MSLELLKKGLSTLQKQVKKRKDALLERLARKEKIPAADEAWLDDHANDVDERTLIDKLEKASDYERGLCRLDSKEKALVDHLKELGGGGEGEEAKGGEKVSKKRASPCLLHLNTHPHAESRASRAIQTSARKESSSCTRIHEEGKCYSRSAH
jgi:hypothetical protein